MFIDERIEFDNIINYILDNSIDEVLNFFRQNYSTLRDPNNKNTQVEDALSTLQNYLEYLYSLDKPLQYLNSTSPNTLINNIQLNQAIEKFIKASNNGLLNKYLNNISIITLSLKKYNSYLVLSDTENLLKKINNSIAFSFEVGKKVTFGSSLSRMNNIEELLELINTLLGEEGDFEIIHVEDGSFKVFVVASWITIKLVSPLIDGLSSNVSSVMDLIHKSKIQNIEQELKEEELRHLIAMNKKEEGIQDIKIDEKLKEQKAKQYKKQLLALRENIEDEKAFLISQICSRFKEEIKHKDNPELLLKKVCEKIEEHLKNNGYIETFLIGDDVDRESISIKENKKIYKERIEKLDHEELKLLEELNADSKE